MGQRADISLTDAAGTPVVHVFKPLPSNSDGLLVWRDSNESIYAGQAVLTVSQRMAGRNSKATKVEWKLETPVLEVTSPSTTTGIQPAPTVAYKPLATISLVLPDRASQQNRKDLLAMLRDLIDEAIVTSQVHDLNMIY